MKLLINAPSGAQELIEVGEGGGYFDPAAILWKDSDGPMPAELQASLSAADKLRAQGAAWEAIKAKRDSLQSDGGVNVGGKWFLSNDREQGRYNSLIAVAAAMGLPGTTVLRAAWRTMQDGVTQDMTSNLARSILTAGFSQFAAIDDAAQAHKAAMEASADPAAYDFSAGWPATFQG